VLEKAVEDWEKRPQDERDLAECIKHFTNANEYRFTKQAEGTKEVLAANEATEDLKALIATAKELVNQAAKEPGKATSTWVPKKSFGLDGIGYCWTHGVCTHQSKHCKFPAEGHQTEATIHKTMGGNNTLNMPQGGRRNNRGRENNTPNTSS
jgi:hypothetical protein